MPTDRDLANSAADACIQDALKAATAALILALETAETDADKATAKQRYQAGLRFCKDARQTLHDLITAAYPAA